MLKKSVVTALMSLVFGVFAGYAGAEKFDPTGWETNEKYPLIGSPDAKKGGTLRYFWLNYPPTLRTNGPNSNLSTTREVHGMVYESLIGLHPTTLEYLPSLATHWKISKDKQKFWFRINPEARWADGTPVTAEDVVATWEFRVREDIKDPYSVMLWGKAGRRKQIRGFGKNEKTALAVIPVFWRHVGISCKGDERSYRGQVS